MVSLMAIFISSWDRRDTTDRVALGEAALAWCKAAKQRDGMRSARFYWDGFDGVTLISEAESMEVFDAPPKPEFAAATFALADLAREVSTKRLFDPRDGLTAYGTAGRI